MPQLQLPIFREGATMINSELAYYKQGTQIIYEHAMLPVYRHDENDLAFFKMTVCQLYINGAAKQVELVKAFGLNALSLKRWVKQSREEGPQVFFIEKRGRPKSKKKSLHVMMPLSL